MENHEHLPEVFTLPPPCEQNLLDNSKTQPPLLWKHSGMAEQPVVKILLVTEVKSLQIKLNPHQEQHLETNSNPQKLNSITQALKISQKKKIPFFLSKIQRIRNKTKHMSKLKCCQSANKQLRYLYKYIISLSFQWPPIALATWSDLISKRMYFNNALQPH